MRRLRRLQRLALAVGAAAWCALPARSAGAESAFAVRGAVSAGGDTNVRRVFGPAEADLVASALLAAAGKAALGPLDLGGSYEAAGRKFLSLWSEDTLAQQAAAEAAVRPLGTVQLALNGRAKDRRGGSRQYTDLASALALRWRAVPELEVELHGGAHRFIDWTVFEYSFSSPEAGASVRYRFDRHHSLSVGGDLGHRRYNVLAAMKVTIPDPPEIVREDGVLTARASYSYRGAFQLSAGYQYYEQDSNSYGETLSFHRVEVAAGVPLPWDLVLFAQVALQLADYPDGISLTPTNALGEDDERQNSLSIKLVRPLGERVDLELRYGLYINSLPANHLFYRRQVAAVGLAARM